MLDSCFNVLYRSRACALCWRQASIAESIIHSTIYDNSALLKRQSARDSSIWVSCGFLIVGEGCGWEMCPGRKLVVKKDISVLPHWKDTAWTGLEDSVKSWARRKRCKRSVGPGLAPTECLVAIRVGPDFTCAVMQTGKVTSEVRSWPRTQRWSMKVEQLLSDPLCNVP